MRRVDYVALSQTSYARTLRRDLADPRGYPVRQCAVPQLRAYRTKRAVRMWAVWAVKVALFMAIASLVAFHPGLR